MKTKVISVDLDADYWETCMPNSSSPGQRLVAAVLERAIMDLFIKTKGEKHHNREAAAWFLTKNTTLNGHFSFDQVCCYLDLDDSTIEKLKKLARAARRKKGKEYELYFGNRSRSQWSIRCNN